MKTTDLPHRIAIALCRLRRCVPHLGLTLLLATSAQAQEAATESGAEPTWYQIEVFIFANDAPDAGGIEHWPDTVELHYPQPIVRLNETGYNSAESFTSSSTAEPAITGDTSNEASPDAGADHADAASTEQPFVKLPGEQRQLNDVVAQISRQQYFRPLFHAAWRQPATERNRANSIIVRGGEQYDDRYELEGSIKLSVERYLHFSTDLWLSDFISAAGLEQMPWPKLPPLPVTSTAQAATSDNDAAWPELTSLQPFSGSDLLNLRERQFIVDRTVVLKQSRRMRSGELHYLDHPLMGVLIKVTPYELTDDARPPAEDDSATSNQ